MQKPGKDPEASPLGGGPAHPNSSGLQEHRPQESHENGAGAGCGGHWRSVHLPLGHLGFSKGYVGQRGLRN